MNPTRPGNEPDPADMSPVPTDENVPDTPDLPDDEAGKLGNFA